MDDGTAAERDLLLEVEQHGSAATLSVSGELDASTAPELSDLCRTVHARGAREVVIDLTDTSFLDSSGLRALVGARQLFGEGDHGSNLRLAHPSEPVIRLLDITGLSAYFTIDEFPSA